ncbi:uncharacterized protein LOC122858662 isoform X1 [Aphidius gifuensis]|uniref:uncharacterized protein LOC122858662 isoform X1 n=1 Tax=Aphidius gifuensis TaxID=684658 RepID=UPI001CDC7E7D|nr:uncharacterized protein LOC122858662 isoform X1 [Aphidius gifuensis]
MIVKLIIIIFSLTWINQVDDVAGVDKWPDSLDESLDEQNDAEIFRAVVDSMKKWELHKRSSRRIKREISRVCYEDVGCFEDTGPFSYLEMLPSPPKDVGTRFFVYGSRKARSIPMEVLPDDINDKTHNSIDSDLPTKVIVHGFGSGCDHVWVYEMRSALMSAHDCNIVCVDWSLGSAIPNYVRAAANTRLVGRQLAKLIRGLNVPLERVHLIGFSLGAHVAGFAGAELGNVSRITGLDPAGPLFESQDPRARLDETDAQFVDVIHSNGEQLILGGLGSWQPMGDVDFYPNGGRMQTGCSNLFVGAVSDFIWSGSIEGRSLCNHRRAYKLFTDSVSPKCRFPAFPCEKGYDGLLQGDCFPCGIDRPCGDMGYYSDVSTARGQLYLVTREEEPFCAHQYQIKLFNNRGERPARSYGKLQVTLVGNGGFNETFTMTKKDDEELLVGAILHKMVVPHPVVVDLEAIEVKYTAYSGWISSGLVSWSIDKVSILDSYGKSLSVCRRGLILESGHPVYLPLYPSECTIPIEIDNQTLSTNINLTNSFVTNNNINNKNDEFKLTGIGPFVKSQNYDNNNGFIDTIQNEHKRPMKNFGPYTKEQNIRFFNDEKINDNNNNADGNNNNDNIKNENDKKDSSIIWSFVDINNNKNDNDKNLLENLEIESGRGFSGGSYVHTTSINPIKLIDTTTVLLTSEIQEPVLQFKKETSRSMKLGEITEPLLRPRSIRQNTNEGSIDDVKIIINDTIEKTMLQQNNDTVLHGFTVQFLPERLAGILAQAEKYARQKLLPLISQYTPSFISNSRQDRQRYFPSLSDANDNYDMAKFNQNNKSLLAKHVEGNKNTVLEKNNWIPINGTMLKYSSIENSTSSYMLTDNTEGKWITKLNDDSRKVEEKDNDWMPIVDKIEANKLNDKIDNNGSVVIKNSSVESISMDNNLPSTTVVSSKINDKKFIPVGRINENNDKKLTDYVGDKKINDIERGTLRSMIFPFHYSGKNDPRTKYIPLLPEEEVGRRNYFQERER